MQRRGGVTGWLVALGVCLGLALPAHADVPSYDVETKTKTASSTTVVTDSTVWTPLSKHSIVLMGVVVSADAAQTFLVETGSTTVIPIQYLPSTGSVAIGFGAFPLWVGAADAALTWTTTTGAASSVLLVGYEALQ